MRPQNVVHIFNKQIVRTPRDAAMLTERPSVSVTNAVRGVGSPDAAAAVAAVREGEGEGERERERESLGV